MEGLPDFTIPTVLSFLSTKDIGRCACVAKEWASCAQEIPLIKLKQQGARARAQMNKAEKMRIDEDLISAAWKGRVEQLKGLIANGAHGDAAGSFVQTPLMAAAIRGYFSVVEVLVTNGANLDATDSDGWTALMMASCFGKADVMEALIRAGASLKAKDKKGRTALDMAYAHDHQNIVSILRRAGD